MQLAPSNASGKSAPYPAMAASACSVARTSPAEVSGNLAEWWISGNLGVTEAAGYDRCDTLDL